MTIDTLVLRLIDGNDGIHTWYTLDRALTSRPGLDPARTLMPALDRLEEAGLITAQGRSDMPKYFITDKGRTELATHVVAAAHP